MPFRPCVSGCGRYLAPGDGHDRCLSCLGIEHAEAAFVDESCPHCGGMTVAGLRTRLRFLQRGGVPVPLLRSRVPPGGYRGEATSGSSRAGLTVTVRNSPKTARAPPVTGTSLPIELPRERAGRGGVPLVSFGAPPDDRMSIATLEGESDQSGDDGSVPLPPSGRSAVPDSDPEMVAMLARAAESVGLEWRPPPCPEPSRLDDWFLRAPPRCLSSRKCMMSSLEHGRHLSLPETAPVAHPPSPPLTAERRGGIRRSRRWSDRLRCNCVQGPLLPGAVIRCSPPGPVGTRRPWPAVPMRPAEKLLRYGVVAGSPGQGTEGPARGWSRPRSSQWASDRHGPRAMSDEGYGAVSGPCDVHHGGPGTPPLAVSGWHEGGRQGTVPECPRVPDRPVRRRGGELRPAVLRCTEADWGNPAHPAPACSCCLHPAAGGSASVYSSPRAAPCRRPRSRAADAAASCQAVPWSHFPQVNMII